MAKFTINDTEYDSDDLDNAQKRGSVYIRKH